MSPVFYWTIEWDLRIDADTQPWAWTLENHGPNLPTSRKQHGDEMGEGLTFALTGTNGDRHSIILPDCKQGTCNIHRGLGRLSSREWDNLWVSSTLCIFHALL